MSLPPIAPNSMTQPFIPPEELALFSQPYGIAGIALHLIMYYLLICVALYQRSPSTLRPLQHPKITSILCSLNGVLASSIVAANFFNTPQTPVLASYLAVNAMLPLFIGSVMLEKVWNPRAPNDQSHALMLQTFGVMFGYPLAVSLLAGPGVVFMAMACWDNRGVRIVTWVALAVFFLAGVGFAVWPDKGIQRTFKEEEGEMGIAEAQVVWGINVALFVCAAMPFFMDCLLAVVVGKWAGVPIGESGEVRGLYAGYVWACLLPLLIEGI